MAVNVIVLPEFSAMEELLDAKETVFGVVSSRTAPTMASKARLAAAGIIASEPSPDEIDVSALFNTAFCSCRVRLLLSRMSSLFTV